LHTPANGKTNSSSQQGHGHRQSRRLTGDGPAVTRG
jgi:hypothetical protein